MSTKASLHHTDLAAEDWRKGLMSRKSRFKLQLAEIWQIVNIILAPQPAGFASWVYWNPLVCDRLVHQTPGFTQISGWMQASFLPAWQKAWEHCSKTLKTHVRKYHSYPWAPSILSISWLPPTLKRTSLGRWCCLGKKHFANEEVQWQTLGQCGFEALENQYQV